MEKEEPAQKVNQNYKAVSIDVQKPKEACTKMSIPGPQKAPTQQGPTGSHTPVSHSPVTKKNHCAIAEQQRIVHCIEELDKSIDKTQDDMKFLECMKFEVEARVKAKEKVDKETAKKQATTVQVSLELQCWQKIYTDNRRTQQSTQKTLDDLGASEHTTSEFPLHTHTHDTPVYQESINKCPEFIESALRKRILMDWEQAKKEYIADLEKRKKAELERHQQNQVALAKVTDEYYAEPENRQKAREDREYFKQTFFEKSKPQGSEALERQRRVDERKKRRGEAVADDAVDESPLNPNTSRKREKSRKCNYIAVDNIPLLLTAEERERDVPFYRRPEYEREVGMIGLQPKLVEDPKKAVDDHINHWRNLPKGTMETFKKSFSTHGRNFRAVAEEVFGDKELTSNAVHLFYITKRLKDDNIGMRDIYRDVRKKETLKKRNGEKVVTRSQKKPSQASMKAQMDSVRGRNEKRIRATQQASRSSASAPGRAMPEQKTKSTRISACPSRLTRSRTEERQWSQYEIDTMKQMLLISGTHFDTISDAIGSKTYRQCESYYFNNQQELKPFVKQFHENSEKLRLSTKRKRKVKPRQTTPCRSPTKKLKNNKEGSSFSSADSSKNEENPFSICSMPQESIVVTQSNQPAPSVVAGTAFYNEMQECEATTSSFSSPLTKQKPPAIVKKSRPDDNEDDKIAQTSLVSLPQNQQTKFLLPPSRDDDNDASSSSTCCAATKNTNETFHQPSLHPSTLAPEERKRSKKPGKPKEGRMTMPVKPRRKPRSSSEEATSGDATSSPDNTIRALRFTRSRARNTSLNSNNSNNLFDADEPPVKQVKKIPLALRKLQTDMQFHKSRRSEPKCPNYYEDRLDIDEDDNDGDDDDDDEDYEDRRINARRAPIRMTIKTTKSRGVSDTLSSSFVASVTSEKESSPSLKRSHVPKEQRALLNRKGKVTKPRQTTPTKTTTSKLVIDNDDNPSASTNIEGSDASPAISSPTKDMVSLQKFSPSVATITEEPNSTSPTSKLSAPAPLQQPYQDDAGDAGLATNNNVVEPLLPSKAVDEIESDALPADVELDYSVKPSPIKSPLTPEEPAEIMEDIRSPVPAHNNCNETNNDDKIRPPFPSPSPSPETIAAAPPKISHNHEPAADAILVSPKHAPEALLGDNATIATQKEAAKVAAVVTTDPVQDKSGLDVVAPLSLQEDAAACFTKDIIIPPSFDESSLIPYEGDEYHDCDFYPQYDPSGESGSEPCFTPPPQTDCKAEFDGAVEMCDNTLPEQQTAASSDVPSASSPPPICSPSHANVICKPQQGVDKVSPTPQVFGLVNTRPNTLVDELAPAPKIANLTCSTSNITDESVSAPQPLTVETVHMLENDKTKSILPTSARLADVPGALPSQTSQSSIPATQPLNLSMKKDSSSSNCTLKKVASDSTKLKLVPTPSHSTSKIMREDSENTKNVAAETVNKQLQVVNKDAPLGKEDKSALSTTSRPSDTGGNPPPDAAAAAKSLNNKDLSTAQRRFYNYHKHKIALTSVTNSCKGKSVVTTTTSPSSSSKKNDKMSTASSSGISRRITAKRPSAALPPNSSARPSLRQHRPHAPYPYHATPWPMNSSPSHFHHDPLAPLHYPQLEAPAQELTPHRRHPPHRCSTRTKKDDVVFIDLTTTTTTTTTAAEAQGTATTTDATAVAAPSSSSDVTLVEHILKSVMSDYMVGGLQLQLNKEHPTYYPSYHQTSHHQQHLQAVSAQNLHQTHPYHLSYSQQLEDMHQHFQWQIEHQRHFSAAMKHGHPIEGALRSQRHPSNQRTFAAGTYSQTGNTWQHQHRPPHQFPGQRAHHQTMLRPPHLYHPYHHLHQQQQTYVPTTSRSAPRPFIPLSTSSRRGIERPSNPSIPIPHVVAPQEQPSPTRNPHQQQFQNHLIRSDVRLVGPRTGGGGVRPNNLTPVQLRETAKHPNLSQNEMYSALRLRTKILDPKQQSKPSQPAKNLPLTRNFLATNTKDQPLTKPDYNPVYEPISDDEFVPSTLTNSKI